MFILSVSEKILFLVCSLGILQGVLLAGLIYFHPKSDRSVNTFLALYIVCISAVMTMPFTINAIGWQNSYVIQPIPLLPGVLLYLYLRSFKERITWQKALPHFLIFFLFFFLTYWNLSAIGKLYPDAKEIPVEGLKRPSTLVIISIRIVQQFLYFFLARKTLKSYQQSILHLYSETSRIDLHWARFLVNGYIILICAFLVIFPLILKYPQYFNSLLLINMAIATPYIYLATYKGVMQPTIWQIQPGLDKRIIEEEIHEAEKIKTDIIDLEKSKAKVGFNTEKIGTIVKKITLLMEQEKLFQETELTLHQLAGKLEVPIYQVSQAFNEGMKKTFYDVINGYRVEEAKRLLLDSKNRNYTILSVGFEAGFNSKTTFNTVFKKFTGLTPTEFRDRQKVGLVAG